MEVAVRKALFQGRLLKLLREIEWDGDASEGLSAALRKPCWNDLKAFFGEYGVQLRLVAAKRGAMPWEYVRARMIGSAGEG